MPVSINGTTASVTGLTNGTSYRFRVAARNAVGLGPYTEPTTAGSPSGAAPPPPAAKPGSTWSVITSSPNVNAVQFLNGKFIAPPRPEYYAFQQSFSGAPRYSTDGATWTTGTGFVASAGRLGFQPFAPVSFAYGSPTGGAPLWLACCKPGVSDQFSGSQNVTWGISTDGVAWTQLTRPTGSIGVWRVLFDGERFIALDTSILRMWWSPDGYSQWQEETSLYVDNVANGRGFYMTGAGTTLRTAVPPAAGAGPTPASTTTTTLPFGAMPVYGGAQAGWLAATASGNYYTSADGATWTARSLPSLYRFSGDLMTTPSWSLLKSGLAYGNGWWLALGSLTTETPGAATRTLLRSPDGITWEGVQTLPELAFWTHLAFGNGKFVATGRKAQQSASVTHVAAWCQ